MPFAAEIPEDSSSSGGGPTSLLTRESRFRHRRTHTKSRTGCAHCRRRRIKCNELKPRCTRCVKGNLTCEYPRSAGPHPQAATTVPRSQASLGTAACGRYARHGLLDFRERATASTSDIAPATFAELSVPTSSIESSPAIVPVTLPHGLLNEDDTSLFQHYLQHTSQIMSFDERDAYPLHVAIPDLATRSPAVMSSLLAIAATCTCCDIIAHPAPVPGDRERVMELLAIADRHHLKSLQGAIQTNVNISTSTGDDSGSQSDQILSNALLMPYYASGSQKVRVWLAENMPPGNDLAEEFLPHRSSWLSLFHALNTAYVSVVSAGDGAEQDPSMPDRSGPDANSEETISGQPMSISRHVLYPIISATFSGALEELQNVAESLSVSILTAGGHSGSGFTSQEIKWLCLTAIDVISDIVNNHFLSPCQPRQQLRQQPERSPALDPFLDTTHPQQPPKRCSAWLHEYLTRLLSISPSRPFRRVAMSFLFRVPLAYLTTVQGIIDNIPSLPEEQGLMLANLSPAETLLLDIHAHWLVLTLFLDGVWFFGRAGVWELGRIVGLVKSRRLVFSYRDDDAGEQWWPASIYAVSVEVGKHATRG
ncbi:hypothetical protein QBC34DRAFT_440062 [Podospora aff. communis PSN243]|uniref:Zn(2)-C6 fungal-type domain-containing protein n=1 Tax=Podospora aff. communis PSN243 TaxID=3040156 RepID=A0AAV9GGL4_9PEZI|nr:hypothetical protein QBC34DRAFT_440062 [Podospora aff. communis PSN243]